MSFWFDEDGLNEECGVFGIFNHPDAFSLDIPYFKVNLVLFFIILYFGLMKVFRISALASLTSITLAGFTVINSINDSFTITYQVFIILLIFISIEKIFRDYLKVKKINSELKIIF